MDYVFGTEGGAISIHALREEGDLLQKMQQPCNGISIHALREEGDAASGLRQSALWYFYPRPPRGGRRDIISRDACARLFLSTPSARRATVQGAVESIPGVISIHALREEGDDCGHVGHNAVHISIHALREEGDQTRRGDIGRLVDFYPRPPRGGRPAINASSTNLGEFLSTPSARRATAKTETKSLFSNKLYNILHEFRRALIYNGSKNYPNHAKRLENPVRRCRKDAEDSPFAPGRKTQNNSRPSCSKGG